MKKSLLFILTLFLPLLVYSQTVFINEFHYDDAGADANEGVEIAGPAGTDLSTFSIVAYNGSNGLTYNTVSLSGTIPDLQNGFGTIWFAIPGLQNGAPDGLALVNNGTVVIQFLSYEGSFTATDDAAIGLTSEDVGVVESSVPEGHSLQLSGTGAIYTDFTWQAPATGTQGQVNTGQTFSSGADTDPPVWTDSYPNAINVVDDKATLVVNIDEPGIAYYIVVYAGSTAPTAAQVKAGVDYDTVHVLPTGNIIVEAASTDYFEIIEGATPEVSYDIWAVSEDVLINLQTTPAMVNITTTPLRTLAITNPQANDVASIGDTLSIEWTSTNIDSLLIAVYSYTDDELFIVSEDDGELEPIEAALGVWELWIPHDADPGNYDFILLDYYDTTFQVSIGPVTLEDNRTLEFVTPQDYQSYYLGDTIIFEWTYTDIDSVLIGAYSYEEDEVFIFTADEETGTLMPIAADRDTFSLVIPPGADIDSVDLLIYDYYDTAFYDRVYRVYLIDTLTPKIDELFPANGSTTVPAGAAFTIIFDEEVFAGTGNFYLREADGTQIEAFDIAGLTIDYDEIVLTPSVAIESEKTYYIDWDNGVVKDKKDLNFLGVTGDGAWKFTTGPDLFISEYVEGSSSNKALEIYNNSGETVDLSNYAFWRISNGGDWNEGQGNAVVLEGSLPDGEVFVICNDAANAAIQAVANIIGTSATWYNGDDAMGLARKLDENWYLIDQIGVEGPDPGTGWDVAGVTNATANHTLIRKNTVTRGNLDWGVSAGTTITNSEWFVMDQDYIDNLGLISPEGSDNTELEAIMLYDTLLNNVTVTSVVDSLAGTASVEILYGMDSQLDSLVAVLTLADGATSSPESGDTLDFTSPVVFTVTAEDGFTSRDWTVTATVSTSASSDAEITSFTIENSFNEAQIQSQATGNVDILMPYGYDMTALAPEIGISAGATISPESGTPQDFSDTVVNYIVTAQDGTTKDWRVAVMHQGVNSSNIYQIQFTTDPDGDSEAVGLLYRTWGIITALNVYQSQLKGYYIQDGTGEWNGIYVYDPDRDLTDNPQVGDSIEVVGTISEYYNVTQIQDLLDYTTISTGNSLPDPVEKSTGYIVEEKNESILISISDATCTNPDLGHGEVEMNDGSGVIRLDDFLYQYDPFVLNTHYDVTGILYYSYSNWKLLPRSAADISEVVGIAELDLSDQMVIYPNPNNGRFTIQIPAEMKANVEISIVSMTGKLIHKELLNNVSYNVLPLDLSNEANGLYFIKISDGTNTAIAKFMKQ